MLLNNFPSEKLTHHNRKTATKVTFIVIVVYILPNILIYILRPGCRDGWVIRQNRPEPKKDQILLCISHLIQNDGEILCEKIVRITKENPLPLGMLKSYISHISKAMASFDENNFHILPI